MEEEQSEFGRGFVYCIGLFLAHAEREMPEGYEDYSLWFNGAADHLYELEIPANLPEDFKKEVLDWQDLCLKKRLAMSGNVTKNDKIWALDKAKSFLLRYDYFLGTEAEAGQWT